MRTLHDLVRIGKVNYLGARLVWPASPIYFGLDQLLFVSFKLDVWPPALQGPEFRQVRKSHAVRLYAELLQSHLWVLNCYSLAAFTSNQSYAVLRSQTARKSVRLCRFARNGAWVLSRFVRCNAVRSILQLICTRALCTCKTLVVTLGSRRSYRKEGPRHRAHQVRPVLLGAGKDHGG